jgi:hypothetical protein
MAMLHLHTPSLPASSLLSPLTTLTRDSVARSNLTQAGFMAIKCYSQLGPVGQFGPVYGLRIVSVMN